MYFDFIPLLNEKTPRPMVPFGFSDIPREKLLGLVDSGSNSTWIDAEWAESLNINLDDLPIRDLTIGNGKYQGRDVDVSLRIPAYKYSYVATVTFVSDWNHSHQILGLKGFFDRFIVRVDMNKSKVTLTPTPRRSML